MSRRKANGGFVCLGAGGAGGIGGVSGLDGGEGGSLLVSVAVGRGCSWDDGVGLSLLGSLPVDGSL